MERREERDSWRWTGLRAPIYSVAAAYRHLYSIKQQQHLSPTASLLNDTFWKCQVPLKVLMFSWRLLHDRLATRSLLQLRSVPIESTTCVLCLQHVEESNHLFVLFPFANQVWQEGKIKGGLNTYFGRSHVGPFGVSGTIYVIFRNAEVDCHGNECCINQVINLVSFSPRATNCWKDKSEKDEYIDLQALDFSSISYATNHFSESNKLGQGGFGPVYKGLLPNGQEIAVKRLSNISGQGLDEFKNEVMLIAKLQHRNLVTLLGCSIQQKRNTTRRTLLGWAKRLEIIGGIARGLLYLHQDSKLKIIHRDLKSSNVLLDSNMNPKISDFGMARTFELDQHEANTTRIMGTYGYMSPEYAVHGSFSVKSDVYSFGVIVLEIINRRKIKEFCDPHHDLNLLGHAWRLWIQQRPMELMDDLVDNSASPSEILRHIHIGLLCVQQRQEDRPNMSSIVLMLNGEKLLPEPSQPGFYTRIDHAPMRESSARNLEAFSLSEMSNSVLEAR
ncbi:G-type lectin S-receptor-like serine/threonine-protein kinase SD1-1 [Glycine soja]